MTTPSTALSTRPVAVEGTVQPYEPGPMHRRVIEILRSPEALAVIKPLIPADVQERAVIIEVYRAVTVNPQILQCTPASIIMAVADCLRADLIIGKTIHLVPVRTKVSARGEPEEYELRLQAWTDYKGDIELVVRAGAARLVEAHAVYEHDRFDLHLGTEPHIVHIPAPMNQERGKIVGFYAVARVTHTLTKICVMRLDEVEKIRRGSKQWDQKHVAECPEWYGCKTTIHRLTKDLPKNPKLARVLALFQQQDAFDQGDDVAGELPPEDRVDTPRSTSAASVDGEPFDVSDFDVEEDPPAAAPAPSTADRVSQPAVESKAAPRQGPPPCPACGGEMWDNRANKTNPKAPDFKCKNAPRVRGGEGCDGVYWPGQWPPKPAEAAQDELRF